MAVLSAERSRATTSNLALYLVRRLLASVATLGAMSLLIFSLIYLAPGSPVSALLGGKPTSPAVVAALRSQYHLDDPFLVQYWNWLRHAVHGDLGHSAITGLPVLDAIRPATAITLWVALYAVVLCLVAGIAFGIRAAVRRGSAEDRLIVGVSVVGISTPAFVSGVFLLYGFAVWLGWFPVYGTGEGLFGRLWHLTLPALALATTCCALVVKLTRVAMISALDQDYVAFARARGVGRGRVLIRYALRNALVPVLTASGLVLTAVIAGSILVEDTFALPGLGKLLLTAIEAHDVALVQGVVLVFATFVIVVNLGVDLLYAAIDPRIRFGAQDQ